MCHQLIRHTTFCSNKNTLTGPPNCKKTTRHHAHLVEKVEKMTKNLNLGIFWQFWGQNCSLKIGHFSEKQVSFKLKVIFSTNFRPKTKKIIRAVFEKNIKVSDFGLIWRPFREYLQIKVFFQKSGSLTFLPL